MRDLKAVFDCLRSAKVTLNASKCVFANCKVDFLGSGLSVDGIKPQHRLKDAINKFPQPATKKELRLFLGMAGFYRAFIKDFAYISQLPNKLTSDNVKFVWDNSCENAFQSLKQQLVREPSISQI